MLARRRQRLRRIAAAARLRRIIILRKKRHALARIRAILRRKRRAAWLIKKRYAEKMKRIWAVRKRKAWLRRVALHRKRQIERRNTTIRMKLHNIQNLIDQQNRDKNDLKNYRPIALLNSIYKILAAITKLRLECSWSNRFNLLIVRSEYTISHLEATYVYL